MHPRRIAALLCLLAIVALRIEPQLLRLPFQDRRALADGLRRYPDRGFGDYPRFLQGVREHTQGGDSITIMVPVMNWDGGYAYAYYRASYFLAGRQVLPLLTPDNRVHPENFDRARLVASWRRELPAGLGREVWRGEGGVLLRH